MPLIKMHYMPDGVTLWVNAVDIKSIYSEDYANRVNIQIEMKG